MQPTLPREPVIVPLSTLIIYRDVSVASPMKVKPPEARLRQHIVAGLKRSE